ncbi:MAG: hypothetical protein GX558_03365 [Clostridiales bacterium]|nr:hypothetical protein [Clostridiales bacterium]
MFFEHLKRICETRGTTVTAAVRAIGGSIGSIDGWKKGRAPVSNVVVRLAEHLDTSTDYLLGRTDNPAPIAKGTRKLDDDELRLIDGLRLADPPVRDTVRRVVDAVLAAPPGMAASVPAAFLPPAGDHAFPYTRRVSRPARGRKRVEGRAAAGQPINTVPSDDDVTISVPAKYLDDDYFIIQAHGDSMIDAGIDSGDSCVFSRSLHFDSGRIMYVQVEGAGEEPDAVIKRVFFHGGQVELRSANPAYEPMLYPAGAVQVMGVLVHVISSEAE